MKLFIRHVGFGRWLFGLLSLVLSLASSAQVQRSLETISAGGGRSSSGPVSIDASIGGLTGVPTSVEAVLNKPGFAGQLADLTHLELTAKPDVLLPGQTSQLGGAAILDDDTQVLLTADDFFWQSSDPGIDSVTADGRATATDLPGVILHNREAAVFGSYQGFIAPAPLWLVPTLRPQLRISPTNQTANEGAPVTFVAAADGVPPMSYQWYWNDAPINQATNSVLTLSAVTPRDRGTYSIVVDNGTGVASASADLEVLEAIEPAAIGLTPVRVVTTTNSVVTFEVQATGTPPLTYQWRLNGVNLTNRPANTNPGELTERSPLSGATTDTLRLFDVRLADAGQYSVTVANGRGTTNSEPATLSIAGLPTIPPDITIPPSIISSVGSGILSNWPGTPLQFTVQSPASGIATFTTAGSTFDTDLRITSDGGALIYDGDSGGFTTSLVRFNLEAGKTYTIELSGFAGAVGDILAQWSFNRTPIRFPEILQQPSNQFVLLDANGDFPVTNVVFTADVRGSAGTHYEWFFDQSIKLKEAFGSSSNPERLSLTVSNVNRGHLGQYRLVATQAGLSPIISDVAVLEAGTEPNVFSRPKFEQVAESSTPNGSVGAVIRVDPLADEVARLLDPSSSLRPASVSVGILGGQLFKNLGGGHQANEANHADVIGGNSVWFELSTTEDGVVLLDTIGSDIDTMLGVYTGPALDALVEQAQNDNGAPDGLRSSLDFRAAKGIRYFVAVDGKNNSVGNLRLNWRGMIPGFQWVQFRATKNGNLQTDHAQSHIRRVVKVFNSPAANDPPSRREVSVAQTSDGAQSRIPTVTDFFYFVGIEPERPDQIITQLVWASNLTFERLATGAVRLTWEDTGYQLQVNQQLNSPNWAPVVAAVEGELLRSYEVQPNSDAQFFRLMPKQ